MDEYIEREAAIDCLMEVLDMPHHAEFLYTDEICGALNSIPAADVRENVKGEWVVHKTKIGNEYTTCSNCKIDFSFRTDKGTLAKLDMRGTNFCPNCGADMREES
jgi:hypothetical protein